MTTLESLDKAARNAIIAARNAAYALNDAAHTDSAKEAQIAANDAVSYAHESEKRARFARTMANRIALSLSHSSAPRDRRIDAEAAARAAEATEAATRAATHAAEAQRHAANKADAEREASK